MEAFLVSFATVLLAEFGDKSQLLTLMLISKYRRIRPVMTGLVLAGLLNHYVTAWLGAQIPALLDAQWIALLTAAVFLLMAITGWKYRDEQKFTVIQKQMPAWLTCFVLYTIAEAADRTQLTTFALAAKFNTVGSIVFGATLGMALGNLPVMLLGQRFAQRFPLPKIRKAAAVLFAAFSLFVLVSSFL